VVILTLVFLDIFLDIVLGFLEVGRKSTCACGERGIFYEDF